MREDQILRLLLGDEPLFQVPSYRLDHPAEFLIYAVLGLFGGIVSTAFVKPLLLQRSGFLSLGPRWRPVSPAGTVPPEQQRDAALKIWDGAAAYCKTNPVLAHILSKLQE